MKTKFVTIIVLFGFIFGIPFIIVGKQYFELLSNLNLALKILLITFTVALGLFVEGFLKKKFMKR